MLLHERKASEMSKHRICNKVLCPYYKHEDTQVIYCKGVDCSSVLHLAFWNKIDSKNYKTQFCQTNYDFCKIKQMLDGIEEDEQV